MYVYKEKMGEKTVGKKEAAKLPSLHATSSQRRKDTPVTSLSLQQVRAQAGHS